MITYKHMIYSFGLCRQVSFYTFFKKGSSYLS